ncbi:MAG: diacylglycerol kinase family lipid kinase [Bacteroidia bacterium]|nr:diacylglycerol kinase family lipid kinase [Bacteroidia bacterium]
MLNQNNTILFLVNPFAGNGNALNAANYAMAIMKQNGYDTALLVSEELGDLSKFTYQFKVENIFKIAVLGGDGTMHEVVNAIMKNQQWINIPIAIFPCGTGNAFNHDIGCLSINKATKLLLYGKPTLLDLCEVITNGSSIWSFNSVGCGMAAHTNKLAEKLRFLGDKRYTIASLIKIITMPTIKAKVTFNNQVYDKEFCLMLACNTRYTGKGMLAAPFAKLNDGLIDFIIIKKASRFRLLMMLPKVFNGNYLNSSLVKLVQTNHIKIETKTPKIINIDGEIKGNTSLEIIMYYQKINVICGF